MLKPETRHPTSRLGINIDHVATIRNARGGAHPCPVRAALLAAKAGADGITAHLREDRRHIRDADMERLRHEVKLPLNMEMAATQEMLAIALRLAPHAVCLVPEKRQEVTTEGGLDVIGNYEPLAPVVHALSQAGIRVSLFINADAAQLEAAKRIGAPAVELHTGAYAHAPDKAHLSAIQQAAIQAAELGLECHAGHGLNYDNVKPIAAIPQIAELNIGHFLMGEALFTGLEAAVRQMRALIDEARI